MHSGVWSSMLRKSLEQDSSSSLTLPLPGFIKNNQGFRVGNEINVLWNSVPSMILAQISAPTPNWGHPPSTVTRWFVLTTLASTVSMSIGRMVRRFMTWGRRESVSLGVIWACQSPLFGYSTLQPFQLFWLQRQDLIKLLTQKGERHKLLILAGALRPLKLIHWSSAEPEQEDATFSPHSREKVTQTPLTSHSTPSLESTVAASIQWPTGLECATNVTWVPRTETSVRKKHLRFKALF